MENYPIFPKECLREIENTNFSDFLAFTDNYLNTIQLSNYPTGNVYLSFYPIAKNIRFLSSYMFKNVLEKRKSVIVDSDRPGEAHHWENVCKRGLWNPWLWTRNIVNSDKSNTEKWGYYFKSFTEKHIRNVSNEHCSHPGRFFNFFMYLSCIKYTFTLSDKYNSMIHEYKNKMQWPEHADILAVQIRRGETCTTDCSLTDRPCYSIEDYIRNIETLLENNKYSHIYISTDSDEEISKIQTLKPEWKLLYIPIDRSNFFRMKGSPVDLEEFCRRDESKIPFIVDSALADLYFISQCKGYISTISQSEFSKCGWYLQMAMQRKICPYININNKEINLIEKDTLLLL